jgi:hypothetical protein
VLIAVAIGELRAGRAQGRRLLALAGAGAASGLLAAWPTWSNVSGSLRVARAIASTSNSGNLHSPLHTIQVLGIWLRGSYKLAPVGTALTLTHALVALALLATVLGAVQVIRSRQYALAGWLALMLLTWLLVDAYVTTWAGAKTLMLTSPVVVLLAWGGVAAIGALARPRSSKPAAAVLGVILLGGVIASDAMQYHTSNLAPTARYREMASLNSRFAGRGPTAFTDFDEYALYELRDLDVGGPDFVYPPRALAAAAGSYGAPVDLNRLPPTDLLAYPLIVTRRDPAVSRPPSAYSLVWQGSYYQVWARRPGAAAALAHEDLRGAPAAQCRRIQKLAQRALGALRLVGAEAPRLVTIPLLAASHPSGWGRQRQGLVMTRPGRLAASFVLPAGGSWNVWVQGQLMPDVELSVDGRKLASVGGQLSGNSLVPNAVPPLAVTLSAGPHRLSVTRGPSTLEPGDGGSAVLDAIFLTPAAYDPAALLSVPVSAWRTLCGRSYSWVEVLRG